MTVFARHALVRRPSPRLADGLITHIDRSDHVDPELAQRQWDGYVAALRDAGWTTHEVPAAPECPDSVFVEDTMVVYGDLAVIGRPGAEERRHEIADGRSRGARSGISHRGDRSTGHPRRRRRVQTRRHGLGRHRRPHERRGPRAVDRLISNRSASTWWPCR